MTITLATLSEATAQEVYSQVRNHLLTQGRKSERWCKDEQLRNIAICVYHSEDGTRCAAGCLVADEEYSESFEGDSWAGLVRRGWVPDTHSALIERLQMIHDSFPPADWLFSLDYLAQESDLIPV